MFIRYLPARIRYEDDQPVALLGVRIAPSYRLVDLPLGTPTTSARSERGTWALYPLGAEVVVVHPDGAVSGPPTDAAAEVGRLAAQERQGELDRQAATTIQQLLAGDGGGGQDRPRRSGDRIWSIPAKAYWLSGPDNDHGHGQARRQGAMASGPGVNSAVGGPPVHAEVAAAPSRPSRSRPPHVLARHASTRHGRRSLHRRRLVANASQGGKTDEGHGHLQQLPT